MDADQRKVVTVLFCDLVGSTGLGESTDPEVLRARLRSYFEDLRTVVERHGGVVEKFIGDAVMAVFGIPSAHEDDALRAVRAAADMQEAVAAHGLEARIGVNTGEVVVGGGVETLVTGDAVNVAARLEQAAAPGEIRIGEDTRLLVRDAVQVEPLEELALRGRSAPLQAFRVLSVSGDAPAVARRLDTPLVGRVRERDRLWRDFEDAVADRSCRLFTLLGPAGIGKSRLVADFLDRVGDDAEMMRGRCLHYGEGITYWPLVEILASIGVQPDDVVAASPEETRVAFRRLLEERATRRPQIVVVDDLQWAEPIFVDLVEHIADLSRSAPIFLLCIARTDFLDSRPGWGGGKLNATSLSLQPLDETERDQLIESLVENGGVEAGVRARIAAGSEGNPLFVEEMVAMVRERGSGAEVDVPPTIHALLQARLDSLADGERLVIGRAAIEGQVFHRGAVLELVPSEAAPEVDEHLASLVRKDLIRPDVAAIRGDDAYRFRHLLIREAAYGAAPKELRAELHARFADWLDRSAAEAAFELDELVGYHLEQAVQLRAELGRSGPAEEELARRAAARLAAAGRAANQRADLPAAASLLQRGADLLAADDPARLRALPELARTLMRRGRYDDARRLLEEALERAQAAGDRVAEGHALLLMVDLKTRTDPTWSTGQGLVEALALAAEFEQLGEHTLLARAYDTAGMCRFVLGHAAEATLDLERAVALSLAAEDLLGEQRSLSALCRTKPWGPAPAREALVFSEGLLSRGDVSVSLQLHALQVRAVMAAMLEDAGLLRESIDRADAIMGEYELRAQHGVYAVDLADALVLAGDLPSAEERLRRSDEVLEEIGDTGVRATLTAQLADVLARQGGYEEAERFVETSRTLAATDDLDAQPRWRTALARVLTGRGDHAEAVRVAEEAAALLEPTDFIWLHAAALSVLALALDAAGEPERAVAAAERSLDLYERKENAPGARAMRAFIDELRT